MSHHEEGQVIKPDLEFVKEVIASGGQDLKKCYQCSTCTVVCNLTPEGSPFPRKEMLYAQWGLKDKLINSPDVWLCHQCSDCTAYCPRGAKPGEVLGAVRKMAIKNYATPSFLGNMVADPKYLLILLAIPAIIIALVIAAKGHWDFSAVPRTPSGEISYSKFLDPTTNIDPIFVTAAAFAVISFVASIKKYWADMVKHAGVAPTNANFVQSIKCAIMEILRHDRFKKCNVSADRSVAHMLVFYSFIGLAITTTWAVVYLYVLKIPSPYPLSDPMKWVGNISAIGLMVGICMIWYNRLKNADKAGLGSYFDWLLIAVIFIVGVTGILAQLLRLGNIAILAYPMYYLHLVFVLFLFIYAPFSKMAHMVYRTVAMVFARHYNRQ